MRSSHITLVGYVPASDADARTGLLAYLQVQIDDVVLDGVTLRRTAAGKLALSFPARTDRHGKRHAIVRPVDDDARRDLEEAILRQVAAASGGKP